MNSPKRQRSASVDSVSTVSTRSSRRSESPGRRPRSPTPEFRKRSPEPKGLNDERPRARSYSSSGSYSRSPSPPPRRREPQLARDSRLPTPENTGRPYRARDDDPPRRTRREPVESRDSAGPPPRRQHYSRSPEPELRRGGERSRRDHPPSTGHRAGDRTHPPEPPRERSLSPFSKRLALTRGIQGGGR